MWPLLPWKKLMYQKILKVALIGKTNAGKSTLINSFVGKTISIINKKINTTQSLIKGILNIQNVQIIFYDTPGIYYLKNKNIIEKKLKINLWQGINESDIILYLIDSKKINFDEIEKYLINLVESNKKIILIFNKTDLINNNEVLKAINKLKNNDLIDSFFNISAKYNFGTAKLLKYLKNFSKKSKWMYSDNEITNRDEIFITNECTRNSILTYLHKEIPYSIVVSNKGYKLLKNGDLKIKQNLIIKNSRYKKMILGKSGEKIKKIRESSQKQINKILNRKIHLYLEIIKDYAK